MTTAGGLPMWLITTAIFAGLAACVPFGLADSILVAIGSAVAVDWTALGERDDHDGVGVWLLVVFICVVAALFAHGGVAAAALVTIGCGVAFLLPRRPGMGWRVWVGVTMLLALGGFYVASLERTPASEVVIPPLPVPPVP